ncbi:MAG: ATP-binding cassette domain-containing protein, partial [Candidatus Methylomirabilis sp.]|nr:ATP-binding cassette domain-containing protein [Deltaproteobacteria bacterium]
RRPLAAFSGGWRMRAALAAVLFSGPDLLLLDEPTNYLDLEGALWLEQFLEDYPGTFLLVSHDRDMLNKAVGAILHLEAGKLALYPGGYDDFERQRRERLSLQEKSRKRQEAERAHIQAFVDRFRAKASKARQAQSRLKALARMEPIAAVVEDRTTPFRFPSPEGLPPPLAALDRVSVGYEPGRPVLRDLTLRVDMDDRIALLGQNGNGKSTFAKLLAGRLAPMAGRFEMSPKARIGFFAQHQLDELVPADSAYRHLAARMGGAAEHQVRARLGAFGFGVEKADVPAESLSGGEKSRLLFALMSLDAPHLMILDEPTNHLDVDSREALVRAINEYEGAVLLVSHDRHLLEACVDRLWIVEGGAVRPFEGDLEDYRRALLESRGGGRREEAKTPKSSAKDERRA